MLAGAGLGDNFGFAIRLASRAAQHRLVLCAPPCSIFAFQVQGGAGAFGQIPAFGQGPSDDRRSFQQVGEFRLKGRVLLRADKGFFQLAQGGHQDLRHMPPNSPK